MPFKDNYDKVSHKKVLMIWKLRSFVNKNNVFYFIM